MKKILLEIQYFHSCPNSSEMINRVRAALSGMEDHVLYQEVLIETNDLAEKVKFRGSPTLLINGEDFEGLDQPSHISLSCRYYPDGLPSTEDIKKRIRKAILK